MSDPCAGTAWKTSIGPDPGEVGPASHRVGRVAKGVDNYRGDYKWQSVG